MNQIIDVNISEIYVADKPAELRCLGLGSCIAVILYDSKNKISGLAHVMLPASGDIKKPLTHPGKFADTAVEALLKKMRLRGADFNYIQAKIFGGANMFASTSLKKTLNVGENNKQAVLHALNDYSIPIVAQDLGGCTGRSIIFDTLTGIVTMRKIKEGITKKF